MSEINIPKAAADAQNAAKSATHAAQDLEKGKGFGHKLMGGFEFAERVHFLYEIGSFLVGSAVPAGVLTAAAKIAGAAVGDTTLFGNLLILTAPLTVAVAAITVCFRRDWFSDAPIIRVPFSGIVLVFAAYLSQWSGIGKAFDGAGVVLRSQWFGSNSTVNMIIEWFRLPYFALLQYYQLYGFWPFGLSVAAGILMGCFVKQRTAPAN
jgi:hypothetical protein